MKKILLVLKLLGFCTLSHSAVNLSYDGSVLPNTSPWSLSPSPSGVTWQLLQDQGRDVLKITDVGNAAASRFLNIRTTLDVTQGNDLFSNDWEFKITMKIPGFDDQSNDAWDVGQNIFTSLVRDLGENVRHMYALHFGRDANGMTLVKSAAQSAVKVISSDYHEYKVTYSKNTNTGKIFIDGEYWQDMTASITTGSGGYFTFGDNQNQTEVRTDRSFFVDHVSLMNVPEPRRMMLLLLGLTAGLMRRKRSSLAV